MRVSPFFVDRQAAYGWWRPPLALGCAALVLGYELPGTCANASAINLASGPLSCWLPQAATGGPLFLERIRVYFVVLLPWFAIYKQQHSGTASGRGEHVSALSKCAGR